MQLSAAQRRPGGYVGGGRPLGGRTLVIGGLRYPGAVSADGWRQRSTLPLEGLRGSQGWPGCFRTAGATGRLRPGPRRRGGTDPAEDEPPAPGMLSIGDFQTAGAVAYARGCPMDQLTAGRKQVPEVDGWGSVPVGVSDSSGVTQG